MQDAKLFEQMLGLQAPWRVKAVELDMKGQRLGRILLYRGLVARSH